MYEEIAKIKQNLILIHLVARLTKRGYSIRIEFYIKHGTKLKIMSYLPLNMDIHNRSVLLVRDANLVRNNIGSLLKTDADIRVIRSQALRFLAIDSRVKDSP